jgi:hypothetical protein
MKIKTVVKSLALLTICPLLLMLLLPTPASEHGWQVDMMQWINQFLKIQSTTTGKLEQFSLFVKTYLSLLCPLWALLIIYAIYKDDKVEQPKLNQFKPLDAVIVFACFSFCIGFATILSLWHLNPSLVSIRVKNSYLFRVLYEYKLGVILAELFYFGILLLALTGILAVLFAIIINIKQRLMCKSK